MYIVYRDNQKIVGIYSLSFNNFKSDRVDAKLIYCCPVRLPPQCHQSILILFIVKERLH